MKPQPYRQLFEKGFTRIDPERAHHGAFRAIRAAGPALRRVPVRGRGEARTGLMERNYEHTAT